MYSTCCFLVTCSSGGEEEGMNGRRRFLLVKDDVRKEKLGWQTRAMLREEGV